MAPISDPLCPQCRGELGTGLWAFFRSSAVFHLFFVVCTCGLWLPFWIASIVRRRRQGLCRECGETLSVAVAAAEPEAAAPTGGAECL